MISGGGSDGNDISVHVNDEYALGNPPSPAPPLTYILTLCVSAELRQDTSEDKNMDNKHYMDNKDNDHGQFYDTSDLDSSDRRRGGRHDRPCPRRGQMSFTKAVNGGDQKLVQGETLPRNYPLLGDLPVLSSPSTKVPVQPNRFSNTTSQSRSSTKKKKNIGPCSGGIMTKHQQPVVTVPSEYICELSQKQMSDPVKSIYGNVFDKPVIENWLKTQGHICPLTGAPLVEADLSPMDELKTQMRKWILQQSMQPTNDSGDSGEDIAPAKACSSGNHTIDTHGSEPYGDDGLYDF